jgi:hypothetical protein
LADIFTHITILIIAYKNIALLEYQSWFLMHDPTPYFQCNHQHACSKQTDHCEQDTDQLEGDILAE